MAAGVFFSTNPAEWTRLEGLYISERKSPGLIQGVNLSLAAVAGACVRGPATPMKITSVARFLEVFGGRDVANDETFPLYGEVWRAITNKPMGAVVVRRVYASDAATASINLETVAGGGGTEVLKVAASSPGTWPMGSRLKVKVEAATDGTSGKFNLRVSYLGQEVVYENLDIRSTTDNLLAVVGEDEANWVVLTKLAAGTPVTAGMAGLDSGGFIDVGEAVASFTNVAGTDGTPAASDYTAGLDDITAFKGAAIAFVAEAAPTHATLQAAIVTKAPLLSDRVILTWAGVHGQPVATEITSKTTAITTASDRIIWCYNSAKMLDPSTGLQIDAAPHHWMACILSQTDVDVHPGCDDTKALNAGIVKLRSEALSRPDLIALREAGISALERDDDGFAFHSGVCSNASATVRSEITTRRQRDFLQLSAASRVKSYVKVQSTTIRRRSMVSEIEAFCGELKDAPRIVEAFEVLDNVTTDAQAAAGLRKILWRVRLIGHLLFIVLETDIDTGVTISTVAAAA